MDSPEAIAAGVHSESYPPELVDPSPMHPKVGECIQGFRIIGLAPDQGTESDLYLVLGAENQKCVLKLYRSGLQPSTSVNDLHLLHPRIASPLLTGTWNGRAYEIAPFFECGSLADLIQRDGSLKLSTARLVLKQLVEALAVLHRAGIQHRDLKPSNILIKSENPLEVVLTDFGSSALATMTLLTQVRTTLAYAAPETLTGLYSRASDYWSLGIILVEILTGQNPLRWLGPPKMAVYQIVQGKVPIPDALPPDWQRLLKGLLERDHYKRWDEARIVRWLAECGTGTVHKQGNWLRGFILTATAALIIGSAGAVGTGIWQLTQVKHTSSALSALSSAKPTEQPSPSIERQLITQALEVKTNPWFRLGLSTCVWLLAIILVLAGFGHCITGTPHGLLFICGGLGVAVVAVILA
jgi:serine/threonine protein kinase